MNSRLVVVKKLVAGKVCKSTKDTRKKLSTVGKSDKSDCKVKPKSKHWCVLMSHLKTQIFQVCMT